MKKLERRAILCLMLVAVILIGLGYFIFRFITEGNEWAAFYTNRAVNNSGHLSRGAVYDKDGEILLKNKNGRIQFSGNYVTRRALVHLTGDTKNNISTGVNNVMADKLVGYSILNGTYSFGGTGRNITLTVDADVCRIAYAALGGRTGTVGVYNYKTGDIICAVSSPNYDPVNPPVTDKNDTSGIYINRLFSSTTPPGSTFKLVTAAAALENKGNIKNWSYYCTGVKKYGPDRVTDLAAHGRVNLEQAVAVSCNCGFGVLTTQLGADVMNDTVNKTGLTSSYNVDGIHTKISRFSFKDTPKVNLAWAGIGQHKDMVNPAAMMVYMGAIGNDGAGVSPKLIKSVNFSNGLTADVNLSSGSKQMIEESTAKTLKRMMRNAVKQTYGQWRFPGLKVCAKSGTAEVNKNRMPNALFTGFINSKKYPYAFFVLVEEGGNGTSAAGTVANTVLQKIVNTYK